MAFCNVKNNDLQKIALHRITHLTGIFWYDVLHPLKTSKSKPLKTVLCGGKESGLGSCSCMKFLNKKINGENSG